MFYYLMLFCTVYHNTQGSVMVNYLTGIVESISVDGKMVTSGGKVFMPDVPIIITYHGR